MEYNAARKELAVRFSHGNDWVYSGVPETVGAAAERLRGDEAVLAFDLKIEGKYQSRRANYEPPEAEAAA
jgi:hypothetical protein